MTKLFALAALATLALSVGCAGTPDDGATSGHQLGLNLTQVSDTVVVGTFTTAHGDVSFRSTANADGAHVEFERAGRVLATDVDFAKFTIDLTAPEGAEITKEDRFVLRALSTVLEEGAIDRGTRASDQLVRQSILWGAHPEGKVVTKHVQADPKRSWTTLCSAGACSSAANYRTFCHDGYGCDTCNSLRFGKYESNNPCRSRCGPSCISVGTSAWTVDCGRHDRCEQHHSSVWCQDEWNSASDDFTFAGNCGC